MEGKLRVTPLSSRAAAASKLQRRLRVRLRRRHVTSPWETQCDRAGGTFRLTPSGALVVQDEGEHDEQEVLRVTSNTVVRADRRDQCTLVVEEGSRGGRRLRLTAATEGEKEAWASALGQVRARSEVSACFELLGLTGEGHFGKVLVARQLFQEPLVPQGQATPAVSDSDGEVELRRIQGDLQAMVAIKELESGSLKRGELEALREFRDAPNPFLMSMRGYFEHGRYSYIVQDFCSAGDLYEVLRDRVDQPMTLDGARVYLGEVVLALEHMHRCGFVHRDIKPENVFVSASGHVKVGDFGFCKRLPADPTSPSGFGRTSTVGGTFAYMAPEQASYQEYGMAVDFWQLGCLLYEVFVGHSPFWVGPGGGSTAAQRMLHKIVRAQWRLPPGFPVPTCTRVLLHELLRASPVDRLQSWQQLKSHVFFEGMDWQDLEEGRLTPWCVPGTEVSTPVYYHRMLHRLSPARWAYRHDDVGDSSSGFRSMFLGLGRGGRLSILDSLRSLPSSRRGLNTRSAQRVVPNM